VQSRDERVRKKGRRAAPSYPHMSSCDGVSSWLSTGCGEAHPPGCAQHCPPLWFPSALLVKAEALQHCAGRMQTPSPWWKRDR